MRTKTIYVVAAVAAILNLCVFATSLLLKESEKITHVLLWWSVVSFAAFVLIIVLIGFSKGLKIYYLDRSLAKYIREDASRKYTLSKTEINYLTKWQLLEEYTLAEFITEFNKTNFNGYIYIEK